jgi:hypothetical protein
MKQLNLINQAPVPRLLALWLGIAVLLTLINHSLSLKHPFTYPHGWHSALQATMARAFAEHGVLALGGVPIQNNPPLGQEPDAYIHWPPLGPILLSLVFQIFGESEAAYHAWSLALLLAYCLALYALVRVCYDNRVGLCAAFALLVMPLTVVYGNMLGAGFFNPGTLLALLGYIKATAAARFHAGWAWFGAGSLVIAILLSWEPLLLPLGLLAIACWRRNAAQKRLALLYSALAAAAFAGILALYLLSSPHLASDLWQTLVYRTGLAPFKSARFNPHTLYNDAQFWDSPPTLGQVLARYAEHFWTTIGPLGGVAISWVVISGWMRRREDGDGRAAYLFGGLFAPWVIWSITFKEHTSTHDLQMILALPAASAALGVAIIKLSDAAGQASKPSTQQELRWLIWAVLPMVMLIPLLLNINHRLREPSKDYDWMLHYGRDIKDATEPQAVILTPYINPIPVYYSARHLIRGVKNDRLLEQVAGRLPEMFPGSPVYLAISPYDSDFDLSQPTERYQLVKETEGMHLYSVK